MKNINLIVMGKTGSGKVNALDKMREERIKNVEICGNRIINTYKSKATKIGFIHGGCIPIIHGMCIKMIADLNSAAGFQSGKGFADEKFADAVVGLIATPFLAVPLLSAAVASAYVQTVGENYLKALISVIHLSPDQELDDNELIKKRLKEELSRLKKEEGLKMSDVTGEQKFNQQQEELERDLNERLDREDLPVANIMVAGITGSGKSTLINAVFGSEMAATGKGKPVTKRIAEYGNKDLPIHIWDTVGLELDSEKTKKSIASIKTIIAKKAEANDPYDRVHAIWYCINSESNRYQGVELEFIKELHSMDVPFIIVLTKCSGAVDEVNKFEDEIKKINASMGMKDIPIVQVVAKQINYRGMSTPISAFGLEKLVEVTLRLLPKFIKRAFIAAQKVSKYEKRSECEEIICSYVSAAQKGFWDKVPLVNTFVTDEKIMKMFRKLGEMYNTVLSPDSIEKIMKESGVDFKNKFFGLISPIDMGYSKKITNLLEQKKADGFSVEAADIEKNERAARMIAFYGYTFIDSIEELWKSYAKKQLKDVDTVVSELIRIINEKLKKQKAEIGG